MQKWKQAFQVAKLELSHSWQGFILCLILTFFLSFLFIYNLDAYLNTQVMGYDFLFITFFFLGFVWAKPNYFQLQHQSSGFIAAPVFLMQLQLPIEQDILIKSRFIVYFFYSLPWQICFLILFYASSINEVLSVTAYLIFSIMWLSVTLYAGTIFPISDAGEQGFFTTKIGGIIGALLYFSIVFIFMFPIYILTNHGIVYWSIILAQKWPWLAATISLIIGFTAVNIHQVYMKKKINKLDYL